MQIGLNMSLSGLRTLDPAASVRALFANDEPGVWFEANDANTLFTDVAGTTPVTTPGDAVALQLDKSQGLTLGPELVTNGGFDADSDWEKSGHWVISGGAATMPLTTGYLPLYQVMAFTSAKTYLVEFDVTAITGTLQVLLNDDPITSNKSNTLTVSATGRFSGLLTAQAGAEVLAISRTGGASSCTIDNISVRELPGNHRTQATTAARPLYALHPVGGVRNLLEYTEEFDNAVWAKEKIGAGTAPVVTSNAALAPDGTMTAERVVFTLPSGATVSDSSQLVQDFTFADATYAGSIYIKSNTGADQDIILLIRNGQVATVTATSEWQRISGSLVATAASSNFGLRARGTFTAETVDLLVWGAQLEQSSTATNYQRVGSFLDVSEEGKARRGRLWYNGTSHFMETGTITPGTDKVQVFAGVRKLSDAAVKVFIEYSTNESVSQGAFVVAAPSADLDNYLFRSSGLAGSAYVSFSGAAPTTNILTALGDISGDSVILRVDGVQEAISTTDQGTGNYLAYPIYFGARAGTSLFFNGYEDTSIIRFGPNLDDTTISKVESYVASKTPASELLIPAGPELVTNGTFDTDVSGWTATRSASLALVSNTIEVTGTGTMQSAASQGITTTIGETYVVSFDLVSETGTARFAVSSQDNLNTAPDILNNLSLSAGQSYTFTFKANATTTYLHLASAGATDVTSWDNVSVRQFIPK